MAGVKHLHAIPSPAVTTKTPRKGSSMARLAAFQAWMESVGITYEPQLLKLEPGTDTCSGAACGVSAVAPIEAGAHLCTIPMSAILSCRNTGIKDILEAERLGGSLGLIAAVMYELGTGRNSPWHGYLRSLATREYLPIFWTDEELSLLDGTEAMRQADADRAAMADDFETELLPLLHKYPGRLPGRAWTLETFRRCASWVASRAFNVNDWHSESMVPLADVFNHKPAVVALSGGYVVAEHAGQSGSDDDSDEGGGDSDDSDDTGTSGSGSDNRGGSEELQAGAPLQPEQLQSDDASASHTQHAGATTAATAATASGTAGESVEPFVGQPTNGRRPKLTASRNKHQHPGHHQHDSSCIEHPHPHHHHNGACGHQGSRLHCQNDHAHMDNDGCDKGHSQRRQDAVGAEDAVAAGAPNVQPPSKRQRMEARPTHGPLATTASAACRREPPACCSAGVCTVHTTQHHSATTGRAEAAPAEAGSGLAARNGAPADVPGAEKGTAAGTATAPLEAAAGVTGNGASAVAVLPSSTRPAGAMAHAHGSASDRGLQGMEHIPAALRLEIAICDETRDGVPMLDIIAASAVAAGCEVHNTYGEHGNAELVHKYGFALLDNPFNEVALDKEQVVAASAARLTAHEMRRRCRFLNTHSRLFDEDAEPFLILPHRRVSIPLFLVLRVLLMPGAEFDAISSLEKVQEQLQHAQQLQASTQTSTQHTQRASVLQPLQQSASQTRLPAAEEQLQPAVVAAAEGSAWVPDGVEVLRSKLWTESMCEVLSEAVAERLQQYPASELAPAHAKLQRLQAAAGKGRRTEHSTALLAAHTLLVSELECLHAVAVATGPSF